MKILIVEDVTRVAQRIRRLTESYYSEITTEITIAHSLEEAHNSLHQSFDVMFLDLNLNGQNGFDLLKSNTLNVNFIIVITANDHEAAKAFDLGIFDFITKPITKDRFHLALERLNDALKKENNSPKYLPIKSYGEVSLVEITKISNIKADGHYTEITTDSGETYLHSFHLDKLLKTLPEQFERVHRSYAINIEKLKKIDVYSGGKYEVIMNNLKRIPLNKTSYKKLIGEQG